MLKETKVLMASAMAGCALVVAGCSSDDAVKSTTAADAVEATEAAETTQTKETNAMVHDNSVYALETTTLEGEPISLGEWKGRVALVVNVASACGLTPQYEGLQALHDVFESRLHGAWLPEQ